jgi:hypothetical protein
MCSNQSPFGGRVSIIKPIGFGARPSVTVSSAAPAWESRSLRIRHREKANCPDYEPKAIWGSRMAAARGRTESCYHATTIGGNPFFPPCPCPHNRSARGRQKLEDITPFRDCLRLNQRQCASRIVNSGLPGLAPFAPIRRHFGALQQYQVFHRRSFHRCTLSTPRSS